MVEKILKYKTTDGIIFDSKDEAEGHQLSLSVTKVLFPDVQKLYHDAISKIADLYREKGWDVERCNCKDWELGPTKCLKEGHTCTCEAGVCKRHTSLYFKNTGCFWCNYTDCSKYGC